jgi:hypothetical protein
VPVGKHLRVHEGDRVRAGDRLSEGPVNPHDILKIKGPRAVQEYLLNEVQEVYRLQGVKINDKHIGVIVRQMLQKVKITDPGQTKFLEGEHVDRADFRETNQQSHRQGRHPGPQRAPAPGHHQGQPHHRVVHQRRLLPGDHARPHRRRRPRRPRQPHRAQGEHHHRTPDPRRSGIFRHYDVEFLIDEPIRTEEDGERDEDPFASLRQAATHEEATEGVGSRK